MVSDTFHHRYLSRWLHCASGEVYLSSFSGKISGIVTSIAVSSTSPNLLFMAVPKDFIVGERFIYELNSGGMCSPFSFISCESLL